MKTINLMRRLLMTIIPAFLIGCASKNEKAEGEWIKGSEDDQLKTIEKHFRGLDLTMMETGYRYNELYWAGKDQNWEYARYQLQKMKLALENGLERRPLRAATGKPFLENALPPVEKAIRDRDTAGFTKQFLTLTTHCNNCHAAEKVPFFNVEIPSTRNSIIKLP